MARIDNILKSDVTPWVAGFFAVAAGVAIALGAIAIASRSSMRGFGAKMYNCLGKGGSIGLTVAAVAVYGVSLGVFYKSGSENEGNPELKQTIN